MQNTSHIPASLEVHPAPQTQRPPPYARPLGFTPRQLRRLVAAMIG